MRQDNWIALAGPHALAYWLSPKPKKLDEAFESRLQAKGRASNYMSYLDGCIEMPPAASLPATAPSIPSLDTLNSIRRWLGPHLPLHMMVPPGESCHANTRVVRHIHSSSVPLNSYIQISDRMYVPTVEYTILQMACALSSLELEVLLDMICSIFTCDTHSEHGLAPRRKLTTPQKIESFLLNCQVEKGYMPHGTQSLVRALRSVVANTASPAETECAIRERKPLIQGGYGLPPFECNKKVDISATRIDGRVHYRYADQLFSKGRLVVEYKGKHTHFDEQTRREDKQRENEFAAAGYSMLILDNENLGITSDMDEAMAQARMVLGIGKLPMDSTAVSKRKALHNDVQSALNHFNALSL